MTFLHGVESLTNWLGNVIMPTLAALFFAGAVYRFAQGQSAGRLVNGGCASLLSGALVRMLEAFAQQAAWNDPDCYWKAIVSLVNWVGNVLLPIYGGLQVVDMVLHFAGVLNRTNIGHSWVRNATAALLCFSVSALVQLAEHFVSPVAAGAQ